MLIPSIDLAGGNAVQLVGGREMAIDAGDPRPLAERFGRVGEVAIVDLDAALGRGDHVAVIEDLLTRCEGRVGGGIRDRATALRWLDAGAARIVVGTAASPEFFDGLPPDRCIAALDARDGEVMVEGWRAGTGTDVLDRLRGLRDHVGGFLVTIIEREGRMAGVDLEHARRLREAAGDATLVLAGGVTTAEEIRALDRLDIDAQVGMSLYTGHLSLADAVGGLIEGPSDGPWPTVIVDELGTALGLAWSRPASLAAALETGRGIYWSRSRDALWEKGATSGATQELLRVDLDCDRDALRFTVRQAGGFCHTGTRTCWGEDAGPGRLARRLAGRRTHAPAGSYTRRLLDDPALLGAKLREEAGELAAAVAGESDARVTEEATDVLYFATTALAARGVPLRAVSDELQRRERRVTRRGGDAKPSDASAASAVVTDAASGPAARAGRTTVDASGRVRLARLGPGARPDRRTEAVDPDTRQAAARIVEDVRRRGEPAVREHAERLGDLEAGGALVAGPAELAAARDALPAGERALLERVAGRIRRFAEAQRSAIRPIDLPVPGGRAGHRVMPVDAAGCYAPGGRFPLPSSMLMTVLTARAAGVATVWAASPRPAAITLAAAAVAGADGLLRVGGAQAIAALAYGAGPVPAADVLCGPGNRWVTAAKQIVAQDRRIDMLAGPSELLVVADGTSDPATVAADLLAQAEHDVDAIPILVTDRAEVVDAVESALTGQLAGLATRETATAALGNGFAVVCPDLDAVVAECDAIAPEHLQLSCADAPGLAARLRHYGGLFVGESAAEVLGDYGAGPNHTLPTGGTARLHAGLSVMDFLRLQTSLTVDDPAAADELARDARALARLEGLAGHAAAAERRIVDPR